MEETEKVEQVNSKNDNQAIKRFDLYADLSNDSNLSVAPLADNEELTLCGFSQFDVLDMQIENMDVTNTGVPVLVTSTNQALQPVHPTPAINTNNKPNSVAKKNCAIEKIMAQGSIFNNYTVVINNK